MTLQREQKLTGWNVNYICRTCEVSDFSFFVDYAQVGADLSFLEKHDGHDGEINTKAVHVDVLEQWELDAQAMLNGSYVCPGCADCGA